MSLPWPDLTEAEWHALIAKDKAMRAAGGPGSGNFGHAGRPGEVGGSSEGGGESSAVAEARPFKGNDGFDWHERPEMHDYARTIPHRDARAVGDYASFSYGDINGQLRGTFEPRIISEFVRPATEEEIAGFKATFASDAKGYAPDDPTNKVEDGRIVRNAFTVDPETGEKVFMSIQRAVPDMKYVKELETKAETINTMIRERGYELEEPIEVQRAAYVPGLSYEELENQVGSVIEEKGFTSTMLGNPNNRLDSYVMMGKSESIYKRTGGKAVDSDEVGTAMRVKIVLPEGTKVAPVEVIRRTEYEYPRVVTPVPESLKDDPFFKEHPEAHTERDYTATPTIKTDNLSDTGQRSEAEILLGSGAQFRIVSVDKVRFPPSPDGSMKAYDVADVVMEYVGGGSSDGRR